VPERRSRVRVLAFPCALAVVAIAGGAAVPATEGCTTHQCDSDCVVKGAPQDPTYCNQGDTDFVPFGHAYRNGNEIVWESAGAYDLWLDFPGERWYWLDWGEEVLQELHIDLHSVAIDEGPDVETYVSSSADASTSAYVPASGQLTEIGCLFNWRVCVLNATCAQYFLRVVVRMHLAEGDAAAGPDGAVETGAPEASSLSDGQSSSDVSDALSSGDGPG
jgi:hypothetical protein